MDPREQILKAAKPKVAPNQKTYSTLSLSDRDSLSSTLGLSKRDLEIAALDLEVWPQRYLRNAGSLGIAGQKKLLQSKALLIGAGGLGGTIAQLLARMGLGALVMADGDSFSEDNLNRQAFSFEPNVGSPKVRVARSEIARINAATEVEVFEGFAAEKEFADLVKGVQVAVDALDNMPSRFRLEKACRDARIPLVHGAVAGFTGQVTTIYPEDVGFRAFYGDPQNAPEKGIEVELGNLAGIVSTIASLQVQEAIKVLTGLGRPLRNRLLFIDSLNGVAETISLK
jgi:molybdopterin/thiamine biosynthesis adenylyltransferase